MEEELVYIPGFVLIITALLFLCWLSAIVAKPEEEWQREHNSETFQE